MCATAWLWRRELTGELSSQSKYDSNSLVDDRLNNDSPWPARAQTHLGQYFRWCRTADQPSEPLPRAARQGYGFNPACIVTGVQGSGSWGAVWETRTPRACARWASSRKSTARASTQRGAVRSWLRREETAGGRAR